jgi:hypothetical protein
MSENSSIFANYNFPSTIPAKVVPPIVNVKKFASYTDIEQQMFYALRQGFLIAMPLIALDGTISVDGTGSYEDLAVQQCELFAATVVDAWPKALKVNPIEFFEQQQTLAGSVNNTGN